MNFTKRCGLGIFSVFALAFTAPGDRPVADSDPRDQRLAAGKELFTREWLAGDKRSNAGDGLGPVFNARSCVACHHQGGVGGAGPKQTNVALVSAFLTRDEVFAPPAVPVTPLPDGPGPVKPSEGHTQSESNAKDGVPLTAEAPGNSDFDAAKPVAQPEVVQIPETSGKDAAPVPDRVPAPRAPVASNLDPVKPPKQPDRAKLLTIHPALRTANSFPLHRFSADKELTKWKWELFGESLPAVVGGREGTKATELEAEVAFTFLPQFTFPMSAGGMKQIDGVDVSLLLSQRNAPPLFGAGLVDRIPDRVLEEVVAEQARAAKTRSPDKPPPKANANGTVNSATPSGPLDGIMVAQAALPLMGRVSRLKDGRIGRFGWKANVASLREFTLQACSNEIGLEVPGFPRAVPAWKKNYKAPGLDMSAEQCEQLIHFVASLPPPAARAPETPQHQDEIAAGKQLFSKVGCATCHRPKLGDVDGIYSDLLLHDMGLLLSDAGIYGETIEEVASGEAISLPTISATGQIATKRNPPKFGAGSREWRTPPLWGLRDSAPYLHDGRADTVVEAVALHGGEGLPAAETFFALTQRERQQVELFLQSLAAPQQ